jgi:hypothetical protein
LENYFPLWEKWQNQHSNKMLLVLWNKLELPSTI